jgi:hypothetical protein
MNLPSTAEQQAWLEMQLPLYTEFQVYTCRKRRGTVMWALNGRFTREAEAIRVAQLHSEDASVSVVKVTINPKGKIAC